ncbi:MAG: tetratricopeptide repeat protein [Bdellovibrionaceae bacterium]|nr:tetratricopeptide repeat protein [Pseudobdellovibrionaceae bacterium]
MIKIIVLLFFISSCNSLSSKLSAKKAALYEKIGVSFLQQNNYPSALNRLLQAEQLDKKNARVQNYLGLSYFALKKYNRSIVHFKKAIALKPKQTEYKNNLAYALVKAKHYSSAFRLLKNNLNDLTYPYQYKTYFYLSLIKAKIKNFSAAHKLVNKSLSLSRNFCPANLQLAQILHKRKKYYQSNEQLLKSFSLCPQHKTTTNIFMQARNHYKLKEYIKAFAIFKKLTIKNTNITGKIKKFLNPKKNY